MAIKQQPPASRILGLWPESPETCRLPGTGA